MVGELPHLISKLTGWLKCHCHITRRGCAGQCCRDRQWINAFVSRLKVRYMLTAKTPCKTAENQTRGSLSQRQQSSRRPSYGQHALWSQYWPTCLLIAFNLLIPDGWTAWLSVPAPGLEPGPARLMVQEVGRRTTVSTRPHRYVRKSELWPFAKTTRMAPATLSSVAWFYAFVLSDFTSVVQFSVFWLWDRANFPSIYGQDWRCFFFFLFCFDFFTVGHSIKIWGWKSFNIALNSSKTY